MLSVASVRAKVPRMQRDNACSSGIDTKGLKSLLMTDHNRHWLNEPQELMYLVKHRTWIYSERA